ncbi:MAG: hypothetical protein SFW65_04910 [Alphaproteobacteria bacterium]|nr:hypothetical protein [Alphaproteobacteria bacterium]
MNTVITIGKRLIPIEHIAFVEPYDPSTNPKLQTSRDYKARIVMINRESVLTEQTPQSFAEAYGFRILEQDQIATNPAVSFRVETFEPADGFTPSKAFAARVLWRDYDGNDQSKLLLAAPEKVLAVVVRGESDARPAASEATAALPDENTMRRPPRRRQANAAADVMPQQ